MANDFWFCRSFENANQQSNKGYFSFLKLGYISIGWSSRMAELQVMNYPFVDEGDIKDRLESALQLEAVHTGNKRNVTHSSEYKCMKNFFLQMQPGDSIVIRNLYTGYREYALGTVISDVEWSNGYELELSPMDPTALYAIRRVKWTAKGNYDDLEKDSHNNVPWFSAQLTLCKLGASSKHPHCLEELIQKSTPMDWKPERALYVIPPSQYQLHASAIASLGRSDEYYYEDDFMEQNYVEEEPYIYHDVPPPMLLPAVMPGGAFMHPIMPISAPITVIPIKPPQPRVPPAAPPAPTNSPTLAPANSPKISPAPPPAKVPKPKKKSTPKSSPTITPLTSTPTPIPNNTPTPATTPTATPTPTPTLTQVTSPKSTPTPSPKITPEPSPKITPLASPKITPAASPKVTPLASPKITPIASPKVTPAPSPKQTPSPSASPKPVSVLSTTPSGGFQIRINLKKPIDSEKQQLSTEIISQPSLTTTDSANSEPEKKRKKYNKKSRAEIREEATQRAELKRKSLAELMTNSKNIKRRKEGNQLYDINTSTKVLVHIDTWETGANLWVDVNLVRLVPSEPTIDPAFLPNPNKLNFISGEVIEVQNADTGCEDSGAWYTAVIKQRKDNMLKVQYVGFDFDTEWISVAPDAFPKRARKYSNQVTGGCILEAGDKVEIMWRDKERELDYSEPFGWYEATVLDIKNFTDTSSEITAIKEKQETQTKALTEFLDRPDDSKMKCATCKEKEVGCVLVKCMHLCLCVDCAATTKQCPLCNADAPTYKKVQL